MRDSDVRYAMLTKLRAMHADDVSTRIVEEMGIWSGAVRVDIAVINGELCGVELKSDRDTLERLPAQSDLYNRVFDRVILVAGQKHIAKASAIVPEWWGLTTARWSGDFVVLEELRPVGRNPSVDPFLLAQLLWKDEALAAMDMRGLAKGWRSKSAPAIHRYLADSLPLEELGGVVRGALKARPPRLRQSIADM